MVFTIHGTKKFRDRVPRTDAPALEQSKSPKWYVRR
jgi:hypothetical protein